MADTLKELSVKFGDFTALTVLDEHGDRWVTIPSMLGCLRIDRLETDYPVEVRMTSTGRQHVVSVGVIEGLIGTPRARMLQKKIEAEWLHFFGYVKGPLGEGASRKSCRESMHLLRKVIVQIHNLQVHHGYEPIDVDTFISDMLYGEMLAIMGYAQRVDWEDLSQWELQNLTFIQNAYTSSLLLYLSQPALHEAIHPSVCLTKLLNILKWDISKTMESMYMAQELSVTLGNIPEFDSKY